MTRVLIDLSHAADGYVGIAQDIRLIFDMLAVPPGPGALPIEVTGLVMPLAAHHLPRLRPGTAPLTVAAALVHAVSKAARPEPRAPDARTTDARTTDSRTTDSRTTGARPRGRLDRLRQIPRVLQSRFSTMPVPDALRGGIWRALFEPTLPPSARVRILARPFVATDLSIARLLYRTRLSKYLGPMQLDVPDGIDAVLFCNPRPLRIPAHVRPLIRYHDAIPITDADLVASWIDGTLHQQLVLGCDLRTIFVCDSPSGEQDLLLVDPRRAGHTRVIPCALAPPLPDAGLSIPGIVATRRTLRASPGANPPALPVDPAPRYVLSVSTFEPRKNFAAVIRAWERVTARDDRDLRLIVVAGRGWLEEEGLRLMAPHVATGRLMHLQGLPADELQALMRNAACFAFPSFAEGFGYPPLEALQLGCPVIASDLPVFRWTLGEAALFVDPYDIEALATAITELCSAPDHETTRARLLDHAEAAVSRFRPDAVAQQWANLLTNG